MLVPSQFTVTSNWLPAEAVSRRLTSDVDPGECSEAFEEGSNIRRASMFTFVPTGTSAVPAEESGRFAVSVSGTR
jgi:hypothetical protein